MVRTSWPCQANAASVVPSSGAFETLILRQTFDRFPYVLLEHDRWRAAARLEGLQDPGARRVPAAQRIDIGAVGPAPRTAVGATVASRSAYARAALHSLRRAATYEALPMASAITCIYLEQGVGSGERLAVGLVRRIPPTAQELDVAENTVTSTGFMLGRGQRLRRSSRSACSRSPRPYRIVPTLVRADAGRRTLIDRSYASEGEDRRYGSTGTWPRSSGDLHGLSDCKHREPLERLPTPRHTVLRCTSAVPSNR